MEGRSSGVGGWRERDVGERSIRDFESFEVLLGRLPGLDLLIAGHAAASPATRLTLPPRYRLWASRWVSLSLSTTLTSLLSFPHFSSHDKRLSQAPSTTRSTSLSGLQQTFLEHPPAPKPPTIEVCRVVPRRCTPSRPTAMSQRTGCRGHPRLPYPGHSFRNLTTSTSISISPPTVFTLYCILRCRKDVWSSGNIYGPVP